MFQVETDRTLHLKAVCAIKGEDGKPLNCGFVLSQAADTSLHHPKPHCSAVKLFIRLCQVQKQKCCNAKIHKRRRKHNRHFSLRQHTSYNTETRTTPRALAALLTDSTEAGGGANR